MDPHLHGQQPDAFDGRERLFSGQRGRGGVLRPSQAGVLPQAQLRGRLDGRVHQHAQRLHGLVPGQADQDRVRHEHHGPSTRARSCGMIGGDGINDESNKTSPAPTRNTDLTKNRSSRSRRRSPPRSRWAGPVRAVRCAPHQRALPDASTQTHGRAKRVRFDTNHTALSPNFAWILRPLTGYSAIF